MAITFHPDGRITGAQVEANVKNTGSGQILETIAATCDGRTVSVPSGNYTITNVTASQTGAATYCLLYTSPSPRDNRVSRMPSSA